MNDAGKRWNKVIGITLVGLLITAGFAACEQCQPDADTKKETPAVSNKLEPDAEEAKQDMPAASTDTALMAPASLPGRTTKASAMPNKAIGRWRKVISGKPSSPISSWRKPTSTWDWP